MFPIKKVNSIICSVQNPPPPPSPVPLTYPRPNTHTRTPTTLHVSGIWGGGGAEAYKRVRGFRVRAEETPLTPDPEKLLPTTPHLLRRSGPDQDLLTRSPSHAHARTRTHALLRVSSGCSSAPSPALPSQHAAPGGVGSSHGGPAQRQSSRRASCGGKEPCAPEQGEQTRSSESLFFKKFSLKVSLSRL